MQKVIRRTLLAEKQAARRLARKKDAEHRDWLKSRWEQQIYADRETSKMIKQARLNRREDWEMGPLAPKRDVGDAKETYGSINSQLMRGVELTKEEMDEVLKPVGGRYVNIVPNDRVVLLEGRDKGKIGKVLSTDPKRNECTVEGCNLVDVAVPQWMLDADDSDRRPIRSLPKPVPLTSVRLVYPLTNPETGETRDVIIKKLVNSRVWHDRHSGTTKWSRIVPGLDIVIPWPKKEPKQYKDNDCDTLRLDVEVRSFVPTLLRPPMPESVIDELRNKYSIFRTRHDPEYIEKKMAEDQENEAKKKLAEEMRSPLKELNRKERKLRKAKGKGELTSDMLAKIGEVIARKRESALEAAGVSKVEATV
ncbi:hypothetical protein F5884DRAFT_77577 [Xylogone sp. PMI_703]|nr:hypothetical protein F5884DRAFT_77577 [Xylogone sp. PMI_703]